jgi:hypothetical protein
MGTKLRQILAESCLELKTENDGKASVIANFVGPEKIWKISDGYPYNSSECICWVNDFFERFTSLVKFESNAIFKIKTMALLPNLTDLKVWALTHMENDPVLHKLKYLTMGLVGHVTQNFWLCFPLLRKFVCSSQNSEVLLMANTNHLTHLDICKSKLSITPNSLKKITNLSLHWGINSQFLDYLTKLKTVSVIDPSFDFMHKLSSIHSTTLLKLKIFQNKYLKDLPQLSMWSFVSNFTNLEDLDISLCVEDYFKMPTLSISSISHLPLKRLRLNTQTKFTHHEHLLRLQTLRYLCLDNIRPIPTFYEFASKLDLDEVIFHTNHLMWQCLKNYIHVPKIKIIGTDAHLTLFLLDAEKMHPKLNSKINSKYVQSGFHTLELERLDALSTMSDAFVCQINRFNNYAQRGLLKSFKTNIPYSALKSQNKSKQTKTKVATSATVSSDAGTKSFELSIAAIAMVCITGLAFFFTK